MEIIEKQVEKVKEVPADNYGYNYGRRDINGKANAGLTLGIIGTALGAWALFGGRRSASLLGGTGTGIGDNVDQKIIESAIIFWFKDVDCKSRNKVVSYFKEY